MFDIGMNLTINNRGLLQLDLGPCPGALSSEWDNDAQRLVFTRPEGYETKFLMVQFLTADGHEYERNLGTGNTIELVNSLTSPGDLRVSVYFFDGADLRQGSNPVLIAIREAQKGGDTVEPWVTTEVEAETVVLAAGEDPNVTVDHVDNVLRFTFYLPEGGSGGGGQGPKGDPGVTFLPEVDADGEISWSNDGGLPNPVSRNIKGPTGAAGPAGPEGPQGPAGADGAQGPEGPPGADGEKGDTGPQGVPGPQGIDGPEGPEGPMGPQGPQGPAGADGTGVSILGSYDTEQELIDAHPTGSPGDAYIVAGVLYVWSAATSTWENVGRIEGPQGPQGIQGPEGPQGADGQQGIQGEQGIQGIQGEPGEKGDTGPAGPVGPQGPQGDPGPQGPEGPEGPPGGVFSFAGRVGDVLPGNGDYTAEMVGADPAGAAADVEQHLQQAITDATNIATTVQGNLNTHVDTFAIDAGGAHGLRWNAGVLEYQDHGGIWHPAAAGVISINGQTGSVTITATDLGAATMEALTEHEATTATNATTRGHVSGLVQQANMTSAGGGLTLADDRPLTPAAARTYGPYYQFTENPNQDGFWQPTSAATNPDTQYMVLFRQRWSARWQPIPAGWFCPDGIVAGQAVTYNEFSQGTMVLNRNGDGTAECLVADVNGSGTWLKLDNGIRLSTTAPAPGDPSPYPDGTVLLVYDA